MIAELIQIGDKVTMSIPQENRDWGYNLYPDGTLATVTGFDSIAYGRTGNLGTEPGIYANKYWVNVLMPDGSILNESAGRIELVDQALYAKRLKAYQRGLDKGVYPQKTRISDLPETPFWEGDEVMVEGYRYVVTRIDYLNLTAVTTVGTPWAAYLIMHYPTGPQTSVSAQSMELVSRGKVWLYFHNQPLHFADLMEEAQFFISLGHADEVANPKTGLFEWTKRSLVAAIKAGTVDGFASTSNFFRDNSRITAYKFRDAELGRRVAAATLAVFATG